MNLSINGNEPDKTLAVAYSEGFLAWLEKSRSSLMLTSYDSGNLVLISHAHGKELPKFFSRKISRCMGIALDNKGLYVSSKYQVHRFNSINAEDYDYSNNDVVYAPHVSYVTGKLDIHDMVVNNKGQLIFVNTAYNCLATLSAEHSFEPFWKPRFISKIIGEDRCHLNGLGLVDGKPKYVTAVSTTDVCDGWRDHMKTGGVVIDIETNEILCHGLSMPHSPRFYQNKLWILNTGTGYFGYVEAGEFVPLVFCPGFARGMSFIGDYAVVGTSSLRNSHLSDATLLSENLNKNGGHASTSVNIIHLLTGKIAHTIEFHGWLKEIYDIAILENKSNPMLIGFQSEEIENMITYDKNGLSKC